jgi:hypothetical protein
MKLRLEEHAIQRYKQRIPSKANREEISIIVNATCHTWKEVHPEVEIPTSGLKAKYFMGRKGHVFIVKGDRLATVLTITQAREGKFSPKNKA